MLITHIRGLIAPLLTTHEPPSITIVSIIPSVYTRCSRRGYWCLHH